MLPLTLVLEFFSEAKKEMIGLQIEDHRSCDEIRSLLLAVQQSCLQALLERHNERIGETITAEQFQNELKQFCANIDTMTTDVKTAMEDMNQTARQTFARLVLYSEFVSQRRLYDQVQLKASGKMNRNEILEFCGLCKAAVQLSNVQNYLKTGTILFGNEPDEQKMNQGSPQDRLKKIQQMIWTAVGYDPEFAAAELQRIVLSRESNEFSSDTQLWDIFEDTMSSLKAIMTNIETDISHLSDQSQGGSTRVVSVQYSEHTIDAHTVQPAGTAPASQATEEDQQHQLRLASQAADLKNSLLDELLAMDEKERHQILQQARVVSENVTQQVLARPTGSERVAFLCSIDAETQRLMTMHKLWQSEHGKGKYHSPSNE